PLLLDPWGSGAVNPSGPNVHGRLMKVRPVRKPSEGVRRAVRSFRNRTRQANDSPYGFGLRRVAQGCCTLREERGKPDRDKNVLPQWQHSQMYTRLPSSAPTG